MTAVITSADAELESAHQPQTKVHLHGKKPQDVRVRIRDGHPEFAALHENHWYREGIKWFCPTGTDEAMFITFHVPDHVSVDCYQPVLYSPPFNSGSRQFCAVPPSTTTTVRYQFCVKAPGMTCADPQIIVTPITGNGDGDGA
jgi:hypothetical protein